MNRYEQYVAQLGFFEPKLARTKAPPSELVIVHFCGFNPVVARAALGKCRRFTLNRFFYQLSRSQCILVDTARGFVYLGNSARAVRALAKTVNN